MAEVSGLALHTRPDDTIEVLAIGDRSSRLARATITSESLDWRIIDLEEFGEPLRTHQFEGIAVAGPDAVLLLRESPAGVVMVRRDSRDSVALVLDVPAAHRRGAGWDDPNSLGEGLVALHDGRLLVAKEKKPRLLIEFAPSGTAGARDVTAGDFHDPAAGTWPVSERLVAGGMWAVDGVDDLSDLVFHDGRLFVLSDQSRMVVTVDLPLRAEAERAAVVDAWELDLSKKDKPEGIAVLPDGDFLVALDTKRPKENLLWFRP
jgi:uncharacterized protein YjiK